MIAHSSQRPEIPSCGSCAGGLVPTDVDTNLHVRLRGEGTDVAWSTTPLHAWTCLACGRTELFAEDPRRLAG